MLLYCFKIFELPSISPFFRKYKKQLIKHLTEINIYVLGDVSKSTKIQKPTHFENAQITCNTGDQSMPCLKIEGVQVLMYGVTMVNGLKNNGVGIKILGNTELNIHNSKFTGFVVPVLEIEDDNHIEMYLSGIEMSNSLTPIHVVGCDRCKLVIENSYFHDNRNDRSGGAIVYKISDSLEIKSSRFINNSGKFGGAIRVYKSDFKISDSTFYNNKALIDGGALYLDWPSQGSTITSTKIENNKAGVNGGGLWYKGFEEDTETSKLNITSSSTLYGNTVTGRNKVNDIYCSTELGTDNSGFTYYTSLSLSIIPPYVSGACPPPKILN